MRQVRIRTPAEIDVGLDLFGQRDGLLFMPEMARHSGSISQVAGQLERVFEYDRWLVPRRPIFVLSGLHCSGAILGSDGPCDRACAILWHGDWLEPL